VDVSLDFRQQVLRERIRNIDAVCITHSHADHIGGMPDIRSYTTGDTAPLVVYGSEETVAAIRSSFAYIFDPDVFVGGGIPRIATQSVSGSFRLFDETITCLPVVHGGLTGATGYRIGNMAYIPDMKSLLPKTEALLFGVKILILNCLRETKPHASHLILSQSMELARRIAPGKCYFTHMSHDINAETDTAKLDPWMAFAYDGLIVDY
jgi:phosphoribosyl 1,2-cyclic phosphate phosphodiesterase